MVSTWNSPVLTRLTYVCAEKDLEEGRDQVVDTLYIARSRMASCPDV